LYDKPPINGDEKYPHLRVGKLRPVMKGSQHRVFGNGSYHAVVHRRRRREAQFVAIHAALTREPAGLYLAATMRIVFDISDSTF
jgi:hypothetical protein